MSDFETLVRETLHDASTRAETGPDVTERVLANAKEGAPKVVALHRRIVWMAPLATAAAVAAVALGISLTSTHQASHRTPGGTNPSVPTSMPPTSPTSPTSSAAPSTPANKATAHKPAPPPRAVATPLSPAAVRNGSWTVPDWGPSGEPCPHGTYGFTNGVATWYTSPTSPARNGEFAIVDLPKQVATEDVNGDGIADVVAVLQCGQYQPIARQVVVLSGRSDGRIVTLASIVSPYASSDPTGAISAVSAGGSGLVDVVFTRSTPNGTQQQTRSYRYQSGTFRQVGGPTQFPDSVDLSLTATADLFIRQPDGTYVGAITFTVYNGGTATAGSASNPPFLYFGVPKGTTIISGPSYGRFGQFTDTQDEEWLPAVDPNGKLTLRFTLKTPSAPTSTPYQANVSATPQSDLKPADNTVTYRLRHN
jgi:hypothetical protein